MHTRRSFRAVARGITAITVLGVVAGLEPGCGRDPLSVRHARDAGQGTGGEAAAPGGNLGMGGNLGTGGNLGMGGSPGVAPGRDVTCTFDGLLLDKERLSAYTESGVTVVATAGGWQAWTGFGSPAPSILFVAPPGTSVTGQVEVTAGSSTFRFASVDLYSSLTSIPYVFTGLRSGAVVFSVSGTISNNSGRFTKVANPNAGDLIDTLEIALTNGTACCESPMGLDNVRLSM